MGNDFMSFIGSHTVASFVIVSAVFGGIIGTGIVVSTYPPRMFINIIHKKPMLNIDIFYFYYQKATAYRMLFVVHAIFYHILKVLGSVMTFVTVYCAVDNNNYIFFCALIAALCSALQLLLPEEQYMKIFAEGARILEYELNTNRENEEASKEELRKRYEEAERIIAEKFV